MIHADAGIALDHAQRLPPTHVHDGDEVDPCHYAVGRPVVAPVVDGEILYPCALAGGGVLILDRVSAGDLRLAGVLIGLAKPVEEDMPLCRLPALFPDRTQDLHDARVHRHGPDNRILGVIEPDRSLLHVDAIDAPRQLQSRLDARAMEGEQGDDWLYVG